MSECSDTADGALEECKRWVAGKVASVLFENNKLTQTIATTERKVQSLETRLDALQKNIDSNAVICREEVAKEKEKRVGALASIEQAVASIDSKLSHLEAKQHLLETVSLQLQGAAAYKCEARTLMANFLQAGLENLNSTQIPPPVSQPLTLDQGNSVSTPADLTDVTPFQPTGDENATPERSFFQPNKRRKTASSTSVATQQTYTLVSALPQDLADKLVPYNTNVSMAKHDKLNEVQRAYVKWYVDSSLKKGHTDAAIMKLLKAGEEDRVFAAGWSLGSETDTFAYLKDRIAYEQKRLREKKRKQTINEDCDRLLAESLERMRNQSASEQQAVDVSDQHSAV